MMDYTWSVFDCIRRIAKLTLYPSQMLLVIFFLLLFLLLMLFVVEENKGWNFFDDIFQNKHDIRGADRKLIFNYWRIFGGHKTTQYRSFNETVTCSVVYFDPQVTISHSWDSSGYNWVRCHVILTNFEIRGTPLST